MGPLILMVVLVCGFWYTQNHYQSRIKLARSDGWNAYFYVAMHGLKFAIQGLGVIFILFVFLLLVSFLANHVLFFGASLHFDLFSWMTEIKVMAHPLFFWLSLLIAGVLALAQGHTAKLALEDNESRQKAYREMAAQDGIEALLVQAIDEDKLIFVTLKSRKVYIGYVAAPRMEHHDTQHLAIIPYISGYRDKDTLRYHEQHRYFELYLSKDIAAESTPLNFMHFRHVIPMNQIEGVSLFDIDTYKSFGDYSTPEPVEDDSSLSA